MRKKYDVTITETLKRTVEVEAESQEQAEDIVADGWRDSKYVLGADDFACVDIEAESVVADLA